jgi:hypothetical protein
MASKDFGIASSSCQSASIFHEYICNAASLHNAAMSAPTNPMRVPCDTFWIHVAVQFLHVPGMGEKTSGQHSHPAPISRSNRPKRRSAGSIGSDVAPVTDTPTPT